MRMSVFVNRVSELNTKMTTLMLITRAVARGHEVLVCEVNQFGLRADDVLTLAGRWVKPAADDHASLTQLVAQPIVTVGCHEVDVIMMRTNPARDRERLWAHDSALVFAQLAADRGTLVLNDPAGLQMASNKLYLARLPAECRPESLVTRDHDAIAEFIRNVGGPCVLKPLHGTHGRDVFRVAPSDLGNLRQIVDVLTRSDYAIVQEYLEAATRGDTRVLLMDGEPLVLDGQSVAIRRVARGDDFRCNVSAGARPEAGDFTAGMLRTVALMSPHLRKAGLFFTGLDFIGTKVVEVNVFSPGGLRAAERYFAKDFTGAVIARIEERVASAKAPSTSLSLAR